MQTVLMERSFDSVLIRHKLRTGKSVRLRGPFSDAGIVDVHQSHHRKRQIVQIRHGCAVLLVPSMEQSGQMFPACPAPLFRFRGVEELEAVRRQLYCYTSRAFQRPKSCCRPQNKSAASYLSVQPDSVFGLEGQSLDSIDDDEQYQTRYVGCQDVTDGTAQYTTIDV